MPSQNKSRQTKRTVKRSTKKSNNQKKDLNLIKFFIQLLDILKLHHWATLSYSTHKATDRTHETISELVDSFVEILLGKPGVSRKIVSIPECSIHTYTLSELKKYVQNVIDKLNDLTNQTSLVTEKDTDLLNLRDEIVGALNQFNYLLTLK